MKESQEPRSTRSPFGRLTFDILDRFLEGCQIIGPDWKYLYVNDAVARQGRRPKEQLLGRTMMECYPGIEHTPMFAVLRQCFEDRVPRRMDNQFTFPDGSTGWFDLRFEPVPEGVFILSLEFTERKRAEEELTLTVDVLQLINAAQTREELLKSILERLKDWSGCEAVGIRLKEGPDFPYFVTSGFPQEFVQEESHLCTYGEDGEVVCDSEGHPIVECMCGNVLCGRFDPAKNFFTTDGCFWSNCTTELLATTTDADRQTRTRNRCNGEGYESVALIPLRSGNETPGLIQFSDKQRGCFTPELIALYRRIADHIASFLAKKQAEHERDETTVALADTQDQLRQAQKLEAVGRLAGGVAHDFNNILMGQIGYCDLMKDRLKEDDPLAKDLAQVRDCAERAAALTRQLLAFSRKQMLQPEVLDLNAVVANLDKMLRRLIGEDIEFVLALANGLGRVKADPSQIEQVIMNLAVNARDAMPQGGRLTIRTANVTLYEDHARHVASATSGPHVMLAISDTGCGMDAQTKARLFEPFFTTKEQGKGTGLGLATVYGIVKQSGGDIRVDSEPDKGTSFKIFLPRVDAETTPTPQRQTSTARGTGELVLLAEDAPALRDLFARMIKSLGYRVEVAANGAEALNVVEKQALRPDVLITDVVMPGMSGKTLADSLRRIQPDLKVLYMSGHTDNAIVHHGVLDPQAPFLQKPFSSVDLAAKIREVLSSG